MKRRGLIAGKVLALVAVAMLALVGSADAKKKKKHKVPPVVTATATATGTVGGQIFSATATCPAGTKALGGGFSAPPLTPSSDDLAVAVASHKVGANQWQATAQFIGGPGPPVTLTTYAYCRKGAPVTTPVTVSTPIPDFVEGVSGATPANASCPAGTVQLSGGFAMDVVLGSSTSPIAIPLSSNRTDPLTWQATAIAGETGHTITSQADCAKNPKAKKGKKRKKKKKLRTPTEVTGDVTSPDFSESVSATALCPTKTFAVNGGFSHSGFSVSNPYFFLITESQAVGTTWRVTGFLIEGDNGQQQLRSYGYCSA